MSFLFQTEHCWQLNWLNDIGLQAFSLLPTLDADEWFFSLDEIMVVYWISCKGWFVTALVDSLDVLFVSFCKDGHEVDSEVLRLYRYIGYFVDTSLEIDIVGMYCFVD
jgi:hypothetical protein